MCQSPSASQSQSSAPGKNTFLKGIHIKILMFSSLLNNFAWKCIVCSDIYHALCVCILVFNVDTAYSSLFNDFAGKSIVYLPCVVCMHSFTLTMRCVYAFSLMSTLRTLPPGLTGRSSPKIFALWVISIKRYHVITIDT